MTTYAFPSITPSTSAWEIFTNTANHVSPLSGAVQTLDRGGEAWRIRLAFNNLTGDDKAELQAFVAKLNGNQHRFTIRDHSHVQRGTLSGTPLVAGAGQTGTSINIDGVGTVSNWMRSGDRFSIDGHLKICTADVNSSGGAATLNFAPRILVAPANNAPVTVSNPTGIFMLANPDNGWTSKPGRDSHLADFFIDAIEDVIG